MGFTDELRAATTVEDFEKLKEDIHRWDHASIFLNISSPVVLRACFQHLAIDRYGEEKLTEIFFIVARLHRVDLMEVFFAEGLVTIASVTTGYTFCGYVNVVIQDGHVDVMKFFLDKGMNPDTIVHHSMSSLIVACYSKKIDIVTLLLDYHADVNFADSFGFTALFNAINSSNVRILDNLIMHGVDLYHRDDEGLNAWDHVDYRKGKKLKEIYQRLVDFNVPVGRYVYSTVKCEVEDNGMNDCCLTMMQKVVDKIGLYED